MGITISAQTSWSTGGFPCWGQSRLSCAVPARESPLELCDSWKSLLLSPATAGEARPAASLFLLPCPMTHIHYRMLGIFGVPHKAPLLKAGSAGPGDKRSLCWKEPVKAADASTGTEFTVILVPVLPPVWVPWTGIAKHQHIKECMFSHIATRLFLSPDLPHIPTHIFSSVEFQGSSQACDICLPTFGVKISISALHSCSECYIYQPVKIKCLLGAGWIKLSWFQHRFASDSRI